MEKNHKPNFQNHGIFAAKQNLTEHFAHPKFSTFEPENRVYDSDLHQKRTEILNADKTFGAVEPEILLDFVQRVEEETDGLEDKPIENPSTETNARINLMMAGSVCFEAAYTIDKQKLEHQNSASWEQILELIDAGNNLYEKSKKFISINTDSPMNAFYRADLQQMFSDVYRDMTCDVAQNNEPESELRKIQPETVSQIQASLTDLQQKIIDDYKSKSLKIDNEMVLFGLEGEVIFLKNYWDKFYDNGNIIALPATERADNGSGIQKNIHDAVLLKQDQGGAWNLFPDKLRGLVEIKRSHNKKYIAKHGLGRYNRIINPDTLESYDCVK